FNACPPATSSSSSGPRWRTVSFTKLSFFARIGLLLFISDVCCSSRYENAAGATYFAQNDRSVGQLADVARRGADEPAVRPLLGHVGAPAGDATHREGGREERAR